MDFVLRKRGSCRDNLSRYALNQCSSSIEWRDPHDLRLRRGVGNQHPKVVHPTSTRVRPVDSMTMFDKRIFVALLRRAVLRSCLYLQSVPRMDQLEEEGKRARIWWDNLDDQLTGYFQVHIALQDISCWAKILIRHSARECDIVLWGWDNHGDVTFGHIMFVEERERIIEEILLVILPSIPEKLSRWISTWRMAGKRDRRAVQKIVRGRRHLNTRCTGWRCDEHLKWSPEWWLSIG